ncbi:hypothetical protein [Arundinibacter roseus]|uniref:hypothetical protein n=1 Tax=Arundinibacter roseus TaxID=2070510 RepID=UPI0026C5E1B9|nr:hypothetical protein [Arundinibacter roseus]
MIQDFITQLKTRNETLWYYGLICLIFSIACLVLTKLTHTQVNQVNAWYKPFKFAFSTFLFSWAMAWYCFYLPNFNIRLFNWTVIVLLGFEIIYIAIQAGRGQLSHFNISTPLYSAMYTFMALAATIVTLYTAYVGLLFFRHDFPALPSYYVWGIRLGIFIFVIFSFQGFVMGSKMTHTIGGADGSPGLPLVHWSTTFGDPRIAHFVGMHALQILPFAAFYLLKSKKMTILISVVYLLLAVFTLVQAMQGKPLFISKKHTPHGIIN